MEADQWVDACGVDDVEVEDVIGFDHGGETYALYRSPGGRFHATDGLCTHERAKLCDGLVMGDTIECPKHNGRFDYTTGAAKRVPARINLCTYPVTIRAGRVLVRLGP